MSCALFAAAHFLLYLVTHTCNDYDYDENPQNHIKVEAAAAVASAFTHCSFLLSDFDVEIFI